jgi:hypothetical protein
MVMARIGILGWGSLIWDPRGLPLSGVWHLGGPKLPIEFSRVSSDERLTLAIDSCAATVPTRYAISARADLDDAICDLAIREGTDKRNIGNVEAAAKTDDTVKEVIRSWAQKNGFDAVVWTDLKPNFKKKKQQAFSLEAAEKHLRQLSGVCQRNALLYIKKAPQEVVTPLRQHLRNWIAP